MEEMKKEMEKMKDQIKALKNALLILSIALLIVTICFWIRYFQIQNTLSGIVRCLQNENLIHQLIVAMYRAF